MLQLDSTPPIPRLEEGKMHGGNTRAHEESPSTVKQRIQEGCHDTQQGASATENFSVKSTQLIKDATSATTSSPVTVAT
jgi:hypothetical protein